MSYDLYVTHPCTGRNEVDSIINSANLDAPTRIALLAAALPTSAKDYARTGDRRGGDGYKGLVFANNPARTPYAQQTIASEKQRLQQLGLWQPAIPDFATLPAYSTFLQFQFTLASPYLSRDDEIFHINDNPVRKDKVFKVPMVAGTAWKGNLRATLWLMGHKEDDGQVQRLLGHSRDETGQSGRLRFYPTFFDRISLEVINPHDRATRAGKQPLYFESVPAGANGVFSLLYVPFDGVTQVEAQADLILVARAIREMMLTYGFSAKKSSGFGEAQDDIQGQIVTAMEPKELKSLSTLEDISATVLATQE